MESRYRFVMTFLVALSLPLSACARTPQDTVTQSATLTVVPLDGGSVTTNLSSGIAVNKGSSLKRKWFVINSVTCPAFLSLAGIKTVYHSSSDYSAGGYEFNPQGTISAKGDVTAFEVRFVLFDIWGDRMEALSLSQLAELAPNSPFEFSEAGEWYASESDVREFFTAVAFVAHVRLADGTTWNYDPNGIVTQLAKIQLHLNKEGLNPTNPAPK